MSTVSITDLVTNPRGWLQRVEAGETLIVVSQEKTVAEIRPVASPPIQPRPAGLCHGQFTVPDDFDAPLPDDLLGDFEGA